MKIKQTRNSIKEKLGKRKAFILLCVLLLILVLLIVGCCVFFGSNGGDEEEYEKTVVTFTGGDGLSEETAFEISTVEQLEYMAYLVNNANSTLVSPDSSVTYATAYYKLAEDIVINDEVFTFLPESGLIHVTDGINVGYLGTGIKGEDVNSQFHIEASIQGAFYAHGDSGYIPGEYAGEIISWESIGNETNPFQGHFDGNDKLISGIFINSSEDPFKGLFGQASTSSANTVEIKNINVVNSLVIGKDNVGGIVGAFDYVNPPLPVSEPIAPPTTPVVATPTATTPVVATLPVVPTP